MSAAPKGGLTTIGKTMAFLQKQPTLYLRSNVKSLELRLAPRNGHWGARHFLKEDLPRMAYSNPHVTFRVDKSRQLTKEKPWTPSLRLEFEDGTKHNVEVDGKLSGDIMKEVIRVAGGSPPSKQTTSPEAEQTDQLS